MGHPAAIEPQAIKDSAGPFHFDAALPESVTGPGIAGAVLDAARRCMLVYGAEKTSMNDVARMAGVSRASIYNHYADREELFEAVIMLGRKMFYQDMATAMDEGDSLEQRIGRAAIVVERWRAAMRSRRWGGFYDDDAAALLLTTKSADPLERLEAILRPYVAAASDRGEVRPDLNIEQAAEWITRILISLAANPPRTFDEDDEASVSSFITSFCVQGLR